MADNPNNHSAWSTTSWSQRCERHGVPVTIRTILNQPEIGDISDSGGGLSFPVGAFTVLLVGAGAIGTTALVSTRNSKRRRLKRARGNIIDTELEALDVAGYELPQMNEYSHPAPLPDHAAGTGTAVAALTLLSDRRGVPSDDALLAIWGWGLVALIDAQRLLSDTDVPLKLQVSEEHELLEETTQTVARQALDIPAGKEQLFQVEVGELRRLIGALRPYRVANARHRAGMAIARGAVSSARGDAVISDLGDRFLRAASVLDPTAPLADSIKALESAYTEAKQKTGALESIYDQLPISSARPAVAAALADVEDDPDSAVARYEKLRIELAAEGDALERDGLSIPAIAALLLMNRDESEVGEFTKAYRTMRRRGFEPDEAVEFALAGLRSKDEIDQVRAESTRLGLPVSITAALIRRRDDGPEIYRELVAELVTHGITGDTNKTIAGILAISLEPAQAVRRWLEARNALAGLGLSGAYADIAAAFGASDPRGAQQFALAYAATRQALARSKIDDADRFAPELAHQGTRRQTDTWTGQPIPPDLRSFDPFTLLFYHWVITKGHSGATGWEPVYRDNSWSADRGSWWGGFRWRNNLWWWRQFFLGRIQLGRLIRRRVRWRRQLRRWWWERLVGRCPTPSPARPTRASRRSYD